VQPHYVARPILAEGFGDPVPVRSIVLPGEVDTVAVPDLSEPVRAEPVRQRPTSGSFGSAGPPGTYRFARGSERYLRLVVDGVRRAPKGQGRQALMSAALRLYGAAKAGRVDPVRATALLKKSMLDRGWDADDTRRGMTMADINRQLEWAWEHAS
jgi:hypothetical protein